jgi:DNA-binding NarL/FixJ family response regulator
MVRILVADDHAVFRRGTCDLLREHLAAVEIEEAKDGPEMVQRAQAGPWDLFIMDVTMPGVSGTELVERLTRTHPSTPILVLSVYPESDYAVRMIRSGAMAYLNKATSVDELVRAVDTLVAGTRYITPQVAETLVQLIQNGPDGNNVHQALSNREFQILPLLANGLRLKEIADKLGVNTNTVSTYRRRVLDKLGLRNNAELTRYAVEHCLLERDGRLRDERTGVRI